VFVEHFDWVRGFIFPYLNFLLFVVGLVFFARKPLSGLFQKRRQEFEQLVASAREAQQKAEEQLRQLNERLAGLDDEVAAIRDGARQAAEEEARKIIEQGEALARYMKDEAVRVAEAEVDRARKNLQEEVLVAVRRQVSDKIRQDMTQDEKKQYIQSQVNRLRAVSTGG